MELTFLNLSLLLSYFVGGGACLHLIEVNIPRHVDLHQTPQLSCKFEVTRGKLYSVKWYKDEFEFFRYMPDNAQHMQTFPVPGVNLDISRSNMTTVTLLGLNFNSSGNYRCEVSKDGPNFETVVRNSNMTVMVYPKDSPTILGIQTTYTLGQFVAGNCTSSTSNPPSELTWFINNQKADSWIVEKYPTIKVDNTPVFISVLGLRFQIQKRHFNHGKLELKCSAKIVDLPAWEKIFIAFMDTDTSTSNGIQAQNRRNHADRMCKSLLLASLLLFITSFFL